MKSKKLKFTLPLAAVLLLCLSVFFFSCAKKADEGVGGDERDAQAQCEADGHTFDEWSVLSEATCTEDGERQRTCSVCGYVEKEALPAEHTLTHVEKAEAENKTSTGILAHDHCTVCGKDFIDGVEKTASELVIPAKATVTGIEYVQPFDNCNYVEWEKDGNGELIRNLTGLYINVTYSDFMEEYVKITDSMVTDVKINDDYNGSGDDYYATVTVSYSGKSCEFRVMFREGDISNFCVDSIYKGELWLADKSAGGGWLLLANYGDSDLLYNYCILMKNDRNNYFYVEVNADMLKDGNAPVSFDKLNKNNNYCIDIVIKNPVSIAVDLLVVDKNYLSTASYFCGYNSDNNYVAMGTRNEILEQIAKGKLAVTEYYDRSVFAYSDIIGSYEISLDGIEKYVDFSEFDFSNYGTVQIVIEFSGRTFYFEIVIVPDFSKYAEYAFSGSTVKLSEYGLLMMDGYVYNYSYVEGLENVIEFDSYLYYVDKDKKELRDFAPSNSDKVYEFYYSESSTYEYTVYKTGNVYSIAENSYSSIWLIEEIDMDGKVFKMFGIEFNIGEYDADNGYYPIAIKTSGNAVYRYDEYMQDGTYWEYCDNGVRYEYVRLGDEGDNWICSNADTWAYDYDKTKVFVYYTEYSYTIYNVAALKKV